MRRAPSPVLSSCRAGMHARKSAPAQSVSLLVTTAVGLAENRHGQPGVDPTRRSRSRPQPAAGGHASTGSWSRRSSPVDSSAASAKYVPCCRRHRRLAARSPRSARGPDADKVHRARARRRCRRPSPASPAPSPAPAVRPSSARCPRLVVTGLSHRARRWSRPKVAVRLRQERRDNWCHDRRRRTSEQQFCGRHGHSDGSP